MDASSTSMDASSAAMDAVMHCDGRLVHLERQQPCYLQRLGGSFKAGQLAAHRQSSPSPVSAACHICLPPSLSPPLSLSLPLSSSARHTKAQLALNAACVHPSCLTHAPSGLPAHTLSVHGLHEVQQRKRMHDMHTQTNTRSRV